MHPELRRTATLLEQDVVLTLGESRRGIVEEALASTADLEITDASQKLVSDVQQVIHDQRFDTTWPACPRHRRHPLEYAAGEWRCPKDDVRIASLGGLGELSRPSS